MKQNCRFSICLFYLSLVSAKKKNSTIIDFTKSFCRARGFVWLTASSSIRAPKMSSTAQWNIELPNFSLEALDKDYQIHTLDRQSSTLYRDVNEILRGKFNYKSV